MLVQTNCVICERAFDVRPIILKYGRGRYCSRSCANKGWFKGRPQPTALVAKRAAALKGRRPSDAALDAARDWHNGRPYGKDAIAKRTAGLRARLADPILGPRLRARLASRRIGYKHKPETKAAIRAAHQRPESRLRASANGKAWRESLTPEQRTAYFRKLLTKKSNTKIEKLVAAELDAMAVTYEAQYAIGNYSADFCVPSSRLIIECDGEWWHQSEKAKARDAKRDAFMQSLGWGVLRLPGKVIEANQAGELIRQRLDP